MMFELKRFSFTCSITNGAYLAEACLKVFEPGTKHHE